VSQPVLLERLRRRLVVRVGREAVAAAVAPPHVDAMTLGGKQLAAFVRR